MDQAIIESNPFLKALRDETERLHEAAEERRADEPDERKRKRIPRARYCVSAGHVGDVLGAPIHTPAGESALVAFAEACDFDVEHDGNDGVLFSVRPAAVVGPDPAALQA